MPSSSETRNHKMLYDFIPDIISCWQNMLENPNQNMAVTFVYNELSFNIKTQKFFTCV